MLHAGDLCGQSKHIPHHILPSMCRNFTRAYRRNLGMQALTALRCTAPGGPTLL